MKRRDAYDRDPHGFAAQWRAADAALGRKLVAARKRLAMVETPEAARLTLTIEDTGVGFDADHATRLFTRFSQADETISRRFGGTGLGLSICHSLTRMMGGEISAASQPGVGSRFMVVLPLQLQLGERCFSRPRLPFVYISSIFSFKYHGFWIEYTRIEKINYIWLIFWYMLNSRL